MRRILALLVAASLALTPTLVVAQSSDGATTQQTEVDSTSAGTHAGEGESEASDGASPPEPELVETSDSAISPVLTDAPTRRDGPGDEIAIGVVAGSCFIAGASFLVVASNRRDELDRVEGSTLYSNEQRRILQQQDEGNRLLGYSLLGVGLLASAGLAVLIHDDGPELSVAPTATRRGGGLAFGARF
jgi:hypothetical protein